METRSVPICSLPTRAINLATTRQVRAEAEPIDLVAPDGMPTPHRGAKLAGTACAPTRQQRRVAPESIYQQAEGGRREHGGEKH